MSPVRQTRDRKTIFIWKSGPDWHFNLESIGRDSSFWSTQWLQKPPCRLGLASLTHHRMRHGQGFPAHFELAPYDTLTTVGQAFSELRAKRATWRRFEMSFVYYWNCLTLKMFEKYFFVSVTLRMLHKFCEHWRLKYFCDRISTVSISEHSLAKHTAMFLLRYLHQCELNLHCGRSEIGWN